jgi:hypothetical protein
MNNNITKCELCEEVKPCIALDLDYVLLDDVCEECWEKCNFGEDFK